ncbi:MAG: DEAD/DEAH box helicase [candidate division Zixibacteria bacterium]|nr:DEAD/DEAH box helicase [candidate division Zixibacteria bacterium]
MKITRLTDFGIPERFIERWTETIGPDLLDWQADAVRHFDLFGAGSLIVVAPTSSGKTFLAEMAATAALTRRRKVVYVAPLKALVAQKYERFREVFASPPLGFRVVVSTRDQRSADLRLRRGDFDIAVTVYEKWHSLLVTHLDLLATVDLVILDEPQLLADPQRGPTVASIVDCLASVAKPPRVLMLAARLPQAQSLAEYLGAPIQTVHRRPVELRLGVLEEGRFHFREHNSGETGDETFPWDIHRPETERPIALLGALAAQGERILVFCSSKADCHRRADFLSAQRGVTGELSEDDRWRLQSGPGLAAPLAEWLTHGVAVHHADLTWHQRTLVESWFASGRAAAVFCTGTLAWGINLPATMVFVDAEKYAGGSYGGRVLPVPLERLEFEGMAGRAGRLLAGGRQTIGRGVLWSHTPCEADLLWQAYVAPEGNGSADDGSRTHRDEDNRRTAAFTPERRLLDWIVSGLARSVADARALAERSPFGNKTETARQEPRPPKTDRVGQCTGSPGTWESALQRLIAAGLAQCDADNRVVPTPRGSIVAGAGIGVDTAAAIMRALAGCSDFDAAIWSAFFAMLPEAVEARLATMSMGRPAHRHELADLWQSHFGEDFSAAIARRFAAAPEAVTVHFPNAAAQARAMLTALVLDDWAAGRPTRDLEQRFHLPIGRLEPVADTISWLFETTAALTGTWPDAARFVADFERAGFEIRHGVRHSAAPLVAALGGLLPRQTLLDLIARGWDDPAALAGRSAVDLAGLAPVAVIDRALRRCGVWAQEHAAAPSAVTTSSTHTITNTTVCAQTGEVSMSPILQLDGAACRARMSVQLAGRTVMLRAKSFKYLLALAAARCLTRDGWIAKQEIEAGENQIKYLYQLRRELAAAGHSAAGLIENDGDGRYRLTLPSQAIRFDLSRLREHADWDIRSRAEQLAAGASPVATAAA